MNKTLVSIVFLVSPVFAQINPLLSPASNLAAAAALPAASRYDLTTREGGRTVTPGRALYRWSIATVVAANAADAASSWRRQESNPFVAGGGTQFGSTSIAIKSGFVATSLLIQHVTLRHRPDLYKKMAWMNFITSGILGGVAQSNMGVH
jgi:hypothetical protein